MNETLTGRVGRIISGSLNAVISAVENSAPEVVLEEALREVDSAIDQVRHELGQVGARKHMASSRLLEENNKHEELTGKIKVALEQNRVDLAEAGVAQQLDIEAQIPVLERAIAEAAEKEQELNGYIQALTAKKREMKTELKRLLDAQSNTAIPDHQTGQNSHSEIANKVEKAESAFNRLLESRTGYNGDTGPSHEQQIKLAELEELNHNNRIKERLAMIRATQEDSSND
ncbi:PspA/IM30 family protein [Amphritea balenae]|uniref:PspA/IM30 family protein n=1 Tax=Amphritea balenae TaxID=452629 RepID=A0A3P1SPC7_9GAMM|nr:PspA/IM30 family protein [Amphritea balenae]RRC98824.1 PspA/IM30 family protein [Amphritea balenae]GGK62081.1 hypothetical protein GCM10007941_10220 [Amphritea balenae]